MDINQQASVKSSRSIFINALPETVWKILTDVNSWTEWHPAVSKANLEGKFAPNAVFKWKSGGFNIASTIKEVVPHKHIGWTGKALGARAIHTWNLTEKDGGVLLETAESFEGWLVNLMKGAMEKNARFRARSLVGKS